MKYISLFSGIEAATVAWQTLETGGVPRRYFLSARACAGIIRRVERRGKALPRELREALETQIRTLGD